MNVLTVTREPVPYRIDGVLQPEPALMHMFVVDGQRMSERLGFDDARPWFGRTWLDGGAAGGLAQLLGSAAPDNQWGSGRLVLFGCHCGSDYCGVISCRLEQDADTVRWLDVRYEGDDDPPPYPGRVERLIFDRAAYRRVLRM